MQFNPGDGTGIVDEINDICQSDNNSYPLESKTRRVNQALDSFFTLALQYDKSWAFDDANQSDFPIGLADLVSGQQSYPFPDELLKVKSVFVKDSTGVFSELTEETDPKSTLTVPSGNSGSPTNFRLIGGSILLDFIPNYGSTQGLKVYFARGASKFVSTDTTKEAGIPSLFHPWLCQSAALPYLVEFQKAQKNDIAQLIQAGKVDIQTFMATRNATRVPRLVPEDQDTR